MENTILEKLKLRDNYTIDYKYLEYTEKDLNNMLSKKNLKVTLIDKKESNNQFDIGKLTFSLGDYISEDVIWNKIAQYFLNEPNEFKLKLSNFLKEDYENFVIGYVNCNFNKEVFYEESKEKKSILQANII